MAGLRELTPGGPVIGLSMPDLTPFRLGTFEVPYSVKYSAYQAKNYTATQIGKRNVKEVSGFLPWDVTLEFDVVKPMYNSIEIAGISIPGLEAVSGALGLDIISSVKDIMPLWQKTNAIKVEHETLNALGIEYLFIANIEFPDPDVEWHLPVRLKCESDDGEGSDNETEGVLGRIMDAVKGVAGL